jgi:hypothetical protein
MSNAELHFSRQSYRNDISFALNGISESCGANRRPNVTKSEDWCSIVNGKFR